MKALLQINRSSLSPLFLFPVIWALGALISQFQLLAQQEPWTWLTLTVVIAVPIAFVAGGLAGSAMACASRFDLGSRLKPLSEGTTRLILVALVVVGWLELIHQFTRIGGVPLLAPDGNVIRFEQGGPTIVLTNSLTIAALIALSRGRSFLSWENTFNLAIGGVAIMGFLLQGGRGSVVLVIAVAFLARWLYWGRPSLKVMVPVVIGLLIIVVGGFYARAKQTPYHPFEAELYVDVLPNLPLFLLPLVPIYLAIATNFLTLQALISYFPAREDFGQGVFNAIGFDLFFPAARQLGDLTGSLTPPWMTSTLAGPLWADGGFLWVVTGLFLVGLIAVGTFVMARRSHALGWCLLAAYFLYMTLFGIYTNLWTQQIDWLVVAPLLLILGYASEQRNVPSGKIDAMAANDEARGPDDDPSRGPSSTRRWLIVSALALVILLLTGYLIQRTLPNPIAPNGSAPIPITGPALGTTMTNSEELSDSQPIYWLEQRADDRVTLRSRAPLNDGSGRTRGVFALGPEQSGQSFDVGPWPGSAEPALYEFSERDNGVEVTVHPSPGDRRSPLRFQAAVPDIAGRGFSELRIATWNGSKPDLFAISCPSPTERCQLRIFSGESDFRRQLEILRLPLFAKRKKDWTLDFAGGPNADLFLIRHQADRNHAEVKVALRSSDFRGISFRREIDLPGQVNPRANFLTGTSGDAPAVYLVTPEKGGSESRVSVFPILLPAGLE